MLKFVIAVLVLIAVALIVWGLLGRRDGEAAAAAREDLRSLRPAEEPAPEPAPAPDVDEWRKAASSEEGSGRASVFDALEDEGDSASESTHHDAERHDPEGAEMFGFGKRKDDSGDAEPAVDAGTEAADGDYQPRRGAGLAEGESAEGAAQSSWTTSMHDPDRTVEEDPAPAHPRVEEESSLSEGSASEAATESASGQPEEGEPEGADHDSPDGEATSEDGAAPDAGEASASLEAPDEPDAAEAPDQPDAAEAPDEPDAAPVEPADPEIDDSEELRQPGDWRATEESGPQVLTAEDAEPFGAGAESRDPSSDAGSPDADAVGPEAQDEPAGRRTSTVEEIRDGGYGVGSAAVFDDGAMPFGHPVKAWEDTRTYVEEGHPHYDAAEPHVWFADVESAERAGFRRVD